MAIFSTNSGNLGSLFSDVIQHILMHKPVDTTSSSQEIQRMEKRILKTIFQLPQRLKSRTEIAELAPRLLNQDFKKLKYIDHIKIY